MIRQPIKSDRGSSGPPRVAAWAARIAVTASVCLWLLVPVLLPPPSPGQFLLAGPWSWRAWFVVVRALGTGLLALATQAVVLPRFAAGPWRELLRLAAFVTAFWLVLGVGDAFFQELRVVAPPPSLYESVYRQTRARYPGSLPSPVPRRSPVKE